MSDVQPFSHGNLQPAVPAESEVFKAELDGFDWEQYAQRQDQLDEALAIHQSPRDLIERLHLDDPENGVRVNNLNNRTIEGKPIAGLDARLAVLSGSAIKLGLPGLSFRGGVAAETKFQGINLRGADFTDSVVPGADFTEADLSGVSFVNSVVSGANFTGANMRGVDFAGAYLIDVEGLSPDQLKTVNLRGARALVTPQAGDKDLASALATRFGNLDVSEDLQSQMDPIPVAFDQKVPLLQSNRVLRGLYGVDLVLDGVDFSGSRMHGLTLDSATA